MQALMMDTPLMISSILKHAERNFPEVEMVSVTVDQPRHRQNNKVFASRCRKLAKALESLGAEFGDRIGTLAWNDFRHMELYYAVSGAGMVCHTINPKLFPEQVAYIINHADDKILFVDVLVVPLLEALQEHIKKVDCIVVLTDKAHMPDSCLENLVCYEELLEAQTDSYEWPLFDENTACGMCYTSGTTGNPKGVVYSHRSTVLHALAGALPDVTGASNMQTSLPVVPMFHVNAWGAPYAALMVGTKLVLPGPKMADGETLHDLMVSEQVSVSSGVPTIWMALLDYLEAEQKTVPSLNRVHVGGAACPKVIVDRFREQHDCEVVQGWGMTETSPGGIGLAAEDSERKLGSAGKALLHTEIKIVDEQGKELGSEEVGELYIKGPNITPGYWNNIEATESSFENGWLKTGDAAKFDEEGFVYIVDRSKDMYISGGENVYPAEVENVLYQLPQIAEAAIIGVPDERWGETGVAFISLKAGESLEEKDLISHCIENLAKFKVPSKVEFIEALPRNATGKVLKRTLREDYIGSDAPAIS